MFDQQFFHYKLIIGLDEVGRGPLAGPVVGCAVSFNSSENLLNILNSFLGLGITDSKKLNQKKRLAILDSLKIDIKNIKPNEAYQSKYFSFCLFEHSPQMIDEINILNAALDAMKLSAIKLMQISKMNNEDAILLIDGNKKLKELDHIEQRPIVKGDSKSVLIGLASIIAKEYRDLLMAKMDEIFPQYGFKKHAGYPTKKHKEAIKIYGPTEIHRKTFGGVKEYCQGK